MHLFAYVAVVLVLLFVNITVTPKVWWFYWVALSWGVGVAFQGWCTFVRKRNRPLAPQSSRQVEHKTPPAPNPPKKRTARQKKPKA